MWLLCFKIHHQGKCVKSGVAIKIVMTVVFVLMMTAHVVLFRALPECKDHRLSR